MEMAQIVLPTHANNHGTAFGGQIAAWCDICAAISAQRFAAGAVVTVSMDQLHFLKPVRKGMVVVLQAQVNRAWRTSMEVGVRVEAEDIHSGVRSHCCTAYLSFVAVDSEGKPRVVQGLYTNDNPVAERRYREAQLRRDTRLKMRELRRNTL